MTRPSVAIRGRPPPAASLALVAVLSVAAPSFAALPVSAQTVDELRGAWGAEEYFMAEGGVHEVQGRIFFSERDWQVLFFVMDEEGRARRGSGEGGSYTLDGGRLVFSHLFNLSVGDELPGLPAAELRMVARAPEGAPLEPTDIRIEGDVLTLHFPSGNRMTFRRRR